MAQKGGRGCAKLPCAPHLDEGDAFLAARSSPGAAAGPGSRCGCRLVPGIVLQHRAACKEKLHQILFCCSRSHHRSKPPTVTARECSAASSTLTTAHNPPSSQMLRAPSSRASCPLYNAECSGNSSSHTLHTRINPNAIFLSSTAPCCSHFQPLFNFSQKKLVSLEPMWGRRAMLYSKHSPGRLRAAESDAGNKRKGNKAPL